MSGAIEGLAALVNLPADYVAPAPAPATPALPGIAAIASQTANLGSAVSALAPDLAQKLSALSAKLDAAQVDPEVLAQITTSDDTGGTALDAVVRKLLAANAAAPAQSQADALSANHPLAPPAGSPKSHHEKAEAQIAPQQAPVVDKPTPASSAHTSATASGGAPASNEPAPAAEADLRPETATSARGASEASVPAAANAPNAPAARIAQAAYQPVAPATVLPQVAFEMVRQFHQGQSRFTIRLDPPELGRIDVKMHVDAAGTVNARLTVERSETLDLFQRDQRALERALTQAGLDGGKANLEFSLKQNPFAGMSNNQGGHDSSAHSPGFRTGPGIEGDDALPIAPVIALYRGTATGGVNLFV